jgi:histidine triad (HIT) family protein
VRHLARGNYLFRAGTAELDPGVATSPLLHALGGFANDEFRMSNDEGMTIFEKIIRREIPAEIVWEDDDAVAFHDVNPQAPVHVLIVPKRVIARLADATENDARLLGKLLLAARKVAEKLDIVNSGYRVVINSGPDAGESVPHLHVHVLGKRQMAWPPG